MRTNCTPGYPRLVLSFILALVLLPVLGCQSSLGQKAKAALGRADLPDMGPKLPLTIKMEFDPGLTSTRLPYINVCNAPMELRIGEELEGVMLQAAGQNFRSVQFAGAAPAGSKPDVVAQITLQQSSLKIQTDGIYDRLPGEVNLEAAVAFKDQGGRMLGERLIKTTYKERLIVEPTQHRCDLVSMDAFAANASVSLAVNFIKEARLLLDPDGSLAASGQPAPILAQPVAPSPPPQAVPSPPAQATPSPQAPSASAQVTPGATGATTSSVRPAIVAVPPVPATGTGSPSLSVKATVLDENGNGILEGGEQVKVRVDVVNTGLVAATGVKIRVSGTPAVVTQFPADTLPVGDLQSGESRSIVFTGTLPQRVQAQRVDLVVTASDASGVSAPASQTLVTSIRRSDERRSARPDVDQETEGTDAVVAPKAAMKRKGGKSSDSIDDIPPPVEGYEQPQDLLLAVGIGAYRDDQIPPRKFAAQDAELVAGYFQSIGGMPGENVRLLQDKRALRADIEEAVLDWLPSKATPDSIIIVYFAGQALVSPAGETFLVPYEGTRNSAARLYRLKDLQAALGKLKTRLTLLIFDGSALRLGADNKAKGKTASAAGPQWEVGSRNIVRLIATSGFQAGLEPDKLKHGLFTYYLLRGLKGEADENGDGEVSLGELASYLSDSVPLAAKDVFRQDQQPVVIPPLSASSKRAALPLSRLANGATPHSR